MTLSLYDEVRETASDEDSSMLDLVRSLLTHDQRRDCEQEAAEAVALRDAMRRAARGAVLVA